MFIKNHTLSFSVNLLGITVASFLIAHHVYAGCRDDDQRKADCSAEECSARYSKVHPACDKVGPRSCGKKMSTETLTDRLDKNIGCLRARQHVAECFKEPDAVHQEQINDAQNAVKKCERFLEQLESKKQ